MALEAPLSGDRDGRGASPGAAAPAGGNSRFHLRLVGAAGVFRHGGRMVSPSNVRVARLCERGGRSPVVASVYAALGLPALAVFFVAKPTIEAALALAGPPGAMRNAIAGGMVLTLISLAFFPGWPTEWLAMLGSPIHSSALVMRPGGILVLLALLKWRRPEARLLVAMACVPQTPGWYEMLPLFLIASNFREAAVLALVSSAAGTVQHTQLVQMTEVGFFRQLGETMIFAAYLPCLIMVLRRPNDGELPAWLAYGKRMATAASPKRSETRVG